MTNPPLNPQQDPLGRQYQGTTCKHGGDCPNGEKCAYPGTDHTSKICCPFGQYHRDGTILGKPYCKNLPPGYYCASDPGCLNNTCAHPQNDPSAQQICCFSGRKLKKGGKDFCIEQPANSGCSNDLQCSSRNCVNGVCSANPRVPQKIQNFILYSVIAIVIVIIFVVIFKLV